MMIGADYDGMVRAVPQGGSSVEGLNGSRAAVVGACSEAGQADAGLGGRIGAVASGLGEVVLDLQRRLNLLDQMMRLVHEQRWVGPLFTSEEQLIATLWVLAGLSDRSTLPPQLAQLATRVEDLSADRTWVEGLNARARRQWLALMGVRWLPELNATGASNCFESLLRFFEEHGDITPNSFCSVVDAVTLTGFQDGIARMKRPRANGKYEAGSDRWEKFFQHQLTRLAGDWNDRSFVLWSEAEQKSMEAGYRWAITRNADPAMATVVLTMGSEFFRWANRQRGQDSDPIALMADHPEVSDAIVGALSDSAGGNILGPWVREQFVGRSRNELYWAMDPRNTEFSYEGAKTLDAEVRNRVPEYATDTVDAADFKEITIQERNALDALGTAIEAEQAGEEVYDWAKGLVR